MHPRPSSQIHRRRTRSRQTRSASVIMEEEFQEAAVLWPDRRSLQDDGRRWPASRASRGGDAAGGGSEARRPGASSAPVGVPVARSSPEPAAWVWGDDDGDGDGDEGAAFVSPHVVAARRRCSASEERAASSVCVGHGRTLKGRDLRCVRTAVLRMTGFLES
ncbi:hypothetical protein ACP70R_034072 [Stipagrostis hirtigluma subsp. patula]